MQCAREGERRLVLIRHRGHGVATNVERFIDREPKRHLLFEGSGTDHIFARPKRHLAARAWFAFVIAFDLGTQDLLARLERFVGFDPITLLAEPVVFPHELATLDVEGVARGNTTAGHQHAFGAAIGDLNLGGDGVVDVLRRRRTCLRNADRRRQVCKPRLAPDVARSQAGICAFGKPVIKREHVVRRRLRNEQVLKLSKLVRLRRGQVVGLRKVFFDVVQLPGVVIKAGGAGHLPREFPVAAPRDPAVVIDGAVAKHLEVLGDPLALCIGMFPGVVHRHAFDGALVDTVDFDRLGDTRSLQNGRRNVDHVMELISQSTMIFDLVRPAHDESVAGPTEV